MVFITHGYTNGLIVSNGIRFPMFWQLMLILTEVHVFTSFPTKSPMEWESNAHVVNTFFNVYSFIDIIMNEIKKTRVVLEIFSANWKFEFDLIERITDEKFNYNNI